MRASQKTIEVIERYYAAMEAKDIEGFGAYYADDMTLTLANDGTVTGAETVKHAFREMLGRVRSLRHDLLDAWEEDGGLVIFETLATWLFDDGTTLKIKACSVCTMVDGKFTDQRIYVDNAPLAGKLA